MALNANSGRVLMLKDILAIQVGSFIPLGKSYDRNRFRMFLTAVQNEEYKKLLRVINIPKENEYRFFEHNKLIYIARMK